MQVMRLSNNSSNSTATLQSHNLRTRVPLPAVAMGPMLPSVIEMRSPEASRFGMLQLRRAGESLPEMVVSALVRTLLSHCDTTSAQTFGVQANGFLLPVSPSNLSDHHDQRL